MNEAEALTRRAAHWLTRELFDEINEPTDSQAHFQRWITGFQRLKNSLKWGRSAHRTVWMAHREANWFFVRHIRRPHHTDEDRIMSVYRLSRALLMACGHFPEPVTNQLRPAVDDPLLYLTVESLLNGHCALLLTALPAHRDGVCRPDRGYNPATGFVAVYRPSLTLN